MGEWSDFDMPDLDPGLVDNLNAPNPAYALGASDAAGGWTDTGQDDVYGDVNAGGDPFGGDGSDFPSDAASTGMLPGGADGQLTPFSPGGGFDFTNLLGGLAGGGARARQIGTQVTGPFGFNYNSGPGVNAVPMLPPGRPGAPGQPGTMTTAQKVGLVVRGIRAATGMRVSGRSLVGLIVKYGFQAAAKLTGAAMGDLLTVFFAAKGVRHHRRGPGLYTIGRKLRAADRLRHRAQKILGRSMHAHRGGGRFRKRRR